MDGIIKSMLALMLITAFICSLIVMWRKANYDEVNDPNRDYHITITDNSLTNGEIYEKEHIPAHTERKAKSEMQAGMGYGINPATGQFDYHYGFFPVTIFYDVDIPEMYVLRIFTEDTERLIYFVNEITVSESVYEEYEIGNIYSQTEILQENGGER
jgi:hypothetical protein